MSMKRLVFLLGVASAWALAGEARVDGMKLCDGPEQCCPQEIKHDGKSHPVELGLVIVGVNDVNEKASTWRADFYLYERWMGQPGFMPQTEIVNETERTSEQFDTTTFDGTYCERSRRIRSNLHTPFNLRTFPFDTQRLRLELSDSEFDSSEVTYAEKPGNAGVDDQVVEQISEREVLRDLQYVRHRRRFTGEGKDYDYATFVVDVKRGWGFHLSKYFLPLLLIVIVSFAVFWIDPDDLSSSVQIGVTCMLAAIALQLAYASSLPNVNYLTIADWFFSISYVAIACAVVQTVFTNRLSRNGDKQAATRVDLWSRRIFPAVLVGAVVVACVRAAWLVH
jgi:neurotransmitter-gated ion-channel